MLFSIVQLKADTTAEVVIIKIVYNRCRRHDDLLGKHFLFFTCQPWEEKRKNVLEQLSVFNRLVTV